MQGESAEEMPACSLQAGVIYHTTRCPRPGQATWPHLLKRYGQAAKAVADLHTWQQRGKQFKHAPLRWTPATAAEVPARAARPTTILPSAYWLPCAHLLGTDAEVRRVRHSRRVAMLRLEVGGGTAEGSREVVVQLLQGSGAPG